MIHRGARTRREFRSALAVALAVCGLATGCRSCGPDETLAPVDLGSEGGDTPAASGGDLAPSWRQIERDGFSNGVLVDWLTESDSPVFQVRVLIPISTRHQKLDAASVAVLSSVLLGDLTLRMRPMRASVALEHAPGRVEFVVRGRGLEGDAILGALGESLGTDPQARRLDSAKKKQISLHRNPESIAAASAVLIGELLGLPREHLYASRTEIEALTTQQLLRAFKVFTDTSHAVVIVHAGETREAFEEGIDALTSAWRGSRLRATRRKVSARIRDRTRAGSPGTVGGRVLGSPAAPIRTVESLEPAPKHAIVMIGRTLPLETPLDRSYARAAQRVLQQDFDVRLAIGADVGVLAIRVPIVRKDAVGSLTKLVDQLESAASVPVRTDRLRQSAELWLGARVVAASLADEDWTRLWSESLDLASDDSEVRIALGRDARTMLETDPVALQKWQAKWMAPRTGEPGWVITVAGADESMRTALSGLGALEGR